MKILDFKFGVRCVAPMTRTYVPVLLNFISDNSVSRPYKQAEFEIIFGEGVSKLGCILDCAEIMDVVLKKGFWYSYGDHRLGQGRDRALQCLKENPIVSEEIEKEFYPHSSSYNLNIKVRSMVIEGIGQVGTSCMKLSRPQHQEEDIFEVIRQDYFSLVGRLVMMGV